MAGSGRRMVVEAYERRLEGKIEVAKRRKMIRSKSAHLEELYMELKVWTKMSKDASDKVKTIKEEIEMAWDEPWFNDLLAKKV